MATPDDIRAYATALPEVEERTHFGKPAFRVRDRLFVSVHDEPERLSAIVGVDGEEAAAAAADDTDVHEVVWRSHGETRIFVGLRVDLGKVSAETLQSLVEHAWRNKAPKRLVVTYDQAADRGGPTPL
jgi:hypothetical protein